jgi:hypothetical protein
MVPARSAALASSRHCRAAVMVSNVLRGKPDQRFLTAGALGKPIVADPWIYPDVRDGKTGLLAVTAGEAETALERLVTDQQLRTILARAHGLRSNGRAICPWSSASGIERSMRCSAGPTGRAGRFGTSALRTRASSSCGFGTTSPRPWARALQDPSVA